MPFSRSPPSGRIGHVAVSYKGYVYIWGGYKEEENENIYFPPDKLLIYCSTREKWNIKTCSIENGPSSYSGSTASVVGQYMYLFGGYYQGMDVSVSHLYRLCLESYEWEKLHPKGNAPSPVDKTVSWEYNDKFYTFGGFGTPSTCNEHNSKFQFVFEQIIWKGWTNQFYEYDPEKNQWSIPEFSGILPLPRAAHAAALVGDKVYVFGGRHGHRRLNDLHCLDLLTMTWSGVLTIKGSIPMGRSWHSLTALSKGILLLFGGLSHDNKALANCWMLNTETLTWTLVWLPFYKPRLWHSACLTTEDEVLIFGGCASNILQPAVRRHAKEIIFVRISPKSLFRLCCDRVGRLQGFAALWSILPQSLQALLNLRFGTDMDTNLSCL